MTSIWPALHHFFARFHHRRSRSAVARGLRHADRFLVLIGVLSALVVSESAGLPALLGDAARVREQPGRRGHACYPSRYGNFDIISPFLPARVRQRRCKDCHALFCLFFVLFIAINCNCSMLRILSGVPAVL